MKKRIQGVIKQTIQRSLLEYARSIILYVIIAALYAILALNMGASQSVHPLYFQMFSPTRQDLGSQNVEATVEFLKRIRTTDEYNHYLTVAKNAHGPQIAQGIERDARLRREKIAQLKELLKRNPKSRDALYGLYQLYSLEGEEVTAQSYLEKAQSIDPMIGR